MWVFWGASALANTILQISNGDRDRHVEVSVGTEIVVTLQTIGPGRYGTPLVSSTALQFLDLSSGPPNPGGPVQIYRFMATSAGNAQISIPFTGGMGPNASTPPFRLKVHLKGG